MGQRYSRPPRRSVRSPACACRPLQRHTRLGHPTVPQGEEAEEERNGYGAEGDDGGRGGRDTLLWAWGEVVRCV